MATLAPLVTIGIPTYNRDHLLNRSIDSALRQSYRNIEVRVSDNASTDRTESICEAYCAQDSRFKYARLSSNVGATANFAEVLKNATGEYFLWLGDDDWLDESYVRRCVDELINDSALAIAYGRPKYYRDGIFAHCGSMLEIFDDVWWKRVISYYCNVVDNGMFYGVMRTKAVRKINFNNTMGGDWLLVANLICSGKAKVLRELSVHRELGGASSSPKAILATTKNPVEISHNIDCNECIYGYHFRRDRISRKADTYPILHC
jgi:glycosyltransferase involved in cell wall biosynthesis